MNTKSKLAMIAASLIVSGSALASPARATLWESSFTRTETVSYKVSEARTPEGAAALYAKLRDTAVRVCSEGSPFGVNDPVGLESCVIEALDTAVRRVSIPMVSALHLQAGKSVAVASR